MMDKSREFTDGGEQTQQQQNSNRSNRRLPTARPKMSVDAAGTRDCLRGVGVSKEQNNLGIRSTLKLMPPQTRSHSSRPPPPERADKSARFFFFSPFFPPQPPLFSHSAEAMAGTRGQTSITDENKRLSRGPFRENCRGGTEEIHVLPLWGATGASAAQWIRAT